jgi:hypothetical protein
MSLIELPPDALLTAICEVIGERLAKLEARRVTELERLERAFGEWRHMIEDELQSLGSHFDPAKLRGGWDDKARYAAFDRVCFNGAEWIAKQNDPGELPGDGWMLTAKRGKGGPAGERGEKGDRGPAGETGAQGVPGPAGATLEAIHVSDLSLIAMRSDGVALECDLEPILTRFRDSSKGSD